MRLFLSPVQNETWLVGFWLSKMRHLCFISPVAPPLKEVTQKDVEMYSSRSLAVATKAKEQHIAMLKRLQQPWWRQKWQEDDELDEEEMEKLESELQLLL